MMEKTYGTLEERADRAEAFARDPKLLALAWSPRVVGSQAAMEDGNKFLQENGVEVPPRPHGQIP